MMSRVRAREASAFEGIASSLTQHLVIYCAATKVWDFFMGLHRRSGMIWKSPVSFVWQQRWISLLFGDFSHL